MILLSEANEPKNAKSSSIVYTSLEATVIITTVALIWQKWFSQFSHKWNQQLSSVS